MVVVEDRLAKWFMKRDRVDIRPLLDVLEKEMWRNSMLSWLDANLGYEPRFHSTMYCGKQ